MTELRRRALCHRHPLLVLGILLAVACGETPPTPASSAEADLVFPQAGLILISIDTLRADRLGCYGYDKETSPILDGIAKESVLFTQVYSNSPKTASSHMSLFTSMTPTTHGVTNMSGRLGITLTQLSPNRQTLGQVLNKAGYWNAAVTCGGNLHPGMGFARGFKSRFVSSLMPIEQTVDQTLRFADHAQNLSAPPFLFIHTYEVHAPYLPPAPYQERFALRPTPLLESAVKEMSAKPREKLNLAALDLWEHKESFGPDDARYLSDLYDAEIAHTDSELGRLLKGLRERGILDRSILVILSDHGEEFGEHGDFEHDQLYSEHLHVPLILRLPGGVLGGSRVEDLASLIDVMPTLLELLDLPAPQTIQGRSLVSAMQEQQPESIPVLSEHVMFPGQYRATLRSQNRSVMFFEEEGRLETYDLVADPGQSQDLGDDPESASLRDALHTRLVASFSIREQLDDQQAGQPLAIDEETRRQLIELGYVGGSDVLPEGTPLDHWPDQP